MDTRKIRKLIELAKEMGIVELEVASENETVRIRCVAEPVYSAAPTVIATPQTSPSPPMQAPAEKFETIETKKYEGHAIKSPMVGTFYIGPSPGAKPYVSIGQRVSPGDTLCVIEAMKMFNKIEADVAGVVSARLVENESPVEYDQPLFIIDTKE